jgi:hypothetical protein
MMIAILLGLGIPNAMAVWTDTFDGTSGSTLDAAWSSSALCLTGDGYAQMPLKGSTNTVTYRTNDAGANAVVTFTFIIPAVSPLTAETVGYLGLATSNPTTDARWAGVEVLEKTDGTVKISLRYKNQYGSTIIASAYSISAGVSYDFKMYAKPDAEGTWLGAYKESSSGTWISMNQEMLLSDFGMVKMALYGNYAGTAAGGNGIKIDEVSDMELTAAPAFTPASPYISGPTEISISCSTAGASIYYTLDGDTPTTGDMSYSGPVTVNIGKTLKAIALANDYLASNVTSQTYIYPPAPAPTFAPPGKYIFGPTAITMSCSTAGASIYYTTDGTNPTTSSPLYSTDSTPVTVDIGTVLKAIAVPPSGINLSTSNITTVTYGEKRFHMGWYAMHASDLNEALGMTPLDESQQHGFDYVMPYFAFVSGDQAVLSYLDSAEERGVKVLIDLHPASISEIQRRVKIVKNHPALYGYYLEDEPEIRDISAETVIEKYNAVKQVDSDPNHPVVLTFNQNLATVQDYFPAADIVARELYTLPRIPYVKDEVTVARNAGKEYLALPGAFQGQGYSMPSAETFRYMVFGAVAAGADGIMPFIFEGHIGQPPAPAAGYRDQIVYPTTDLLTSIVPLLAKGSNGLVSSSAIASANSITWVFKGDSNDAVLVAANNSSSSRSSIDFTVDGVDHPVTSVTVVGESRTVTMNSNGQITDSFAGYGSHIYKFTAATSGDANCDGAVNVTDLSVLAAYYNTTSGATWAMGDFDGDHNVDVTDLSMLAANYNSGSTSTLSWADAYAQAFGATSDVDETADASANESEDTNNTTCSSLGLSLIGGLAILGLMLIKLDE